MSASATRVAYRHLTRKARSPLDDALQTLNTLGNLSEELTDVENAFAQHFKMGAKLDPEVNSQFQALQKARKGLKAAEGALAQIKQIADAYPDDKTAQRALKDADVMMRRFQRHADAAQKIIKKLSKKQMPASLAKLSKSVAAAIKRRLIDTKKLQVLPWQNTKTFYMSGGYRSRSVEGIEYQVVFRIEDPDLMTHSKKAEIILAESTVLNSGPYIASDYQHTPVDQKTATAKFLEQLDGWPGVKGMSETIEGRARIAKQVASALNSALRRIRAYDWREAEISRDNKNISGEYRSDLPKEGERAVGEWEYERMVEAEIKNWRKVLDAALKPYSNSIAKVGIHDGEKSWIYTEITLK